jgi:hypothetical protein
MKLTHPIVLVFVLLVVVFVGLTVTAPVPAAIPKQIWTYWNEPREAQQSAHLAADADASKLPRTVQMCMDGWRARHPTYKITLLSRDNYTTYTEIPNRLVDHKNFHDNPTRFSDLVRIWTLAQHGGIWIDSSVLVKRPLEEWMSPPGGCPTPEFIGYYIDGMTTRAPVIENWFYAAPPTSPFVVAWRDEFAKIADFPSVSDYVENRRALGVDISKIISPEYLAQHVAAQKVLQLDVYPQDRLYLRRAEDGPFRYLADHDWDSTKALHAACGNPAYQSPIMKMRGVEREVLESAMGELAPNKCGWN